jgi:LysR family carnitine catabolism transcriptional activator
LKPAPAEGLSFEGIGFDVAHLVCRRDHPLARRRRLQWHDVGDYPFIGITRISSVRHLTDAAFVHGELAIEPRYEVEQVPSAVALVEAGLGVTALPSLTFAMFKNRDLVTRPLGSPVVRRHVGFIARSQRTPSDFVADLKRAIRKQIEPQLQKM